MKRKDSKDMLALRKVVELESRVLHKSLLQVDPYFQCFSQVLASILVKFIIDRFAPILSQSVVLSITSHINLFASFPKSPCIIINCDDEQRIESP
jgi:hypothetical protein